MTFIPLQIPPGVYRNGTDLQSQGRWRDSNLVRWLDDTLRPIGGWRIRSNTAAGAKIRGMKGWIDNELRPLDRRGNLRRSICLQFSRHSL
jgi:hypothetical protein